MQKNNLVSKGFTLVYLTNYNLIKFRMSDNEKYDKKVLMKSSYLNIDVTLSKLPGIHPGERTLSKKLYFISIKESTSASAFYSLFIAVRLASMSIVKFTIFPLFNVRDEEYLFEYFCARSMRQYWSLGNLFKFHILHVDISPLRRTQSCWGNDKKTPKCLMLTSSSSFNIK